MVQEKAQKGLFSVKLNPRVVTFIFYQALIYLVRSKTVDWLLHL